jgi:hypothetical protein
LVKRQVGETASWRNVVAPSFFFFFETDSYSPAALGNEAATRRPREKVRKTFFIVIIISFATAATVVNDAEALF